MPVPLQSDPQVARSIRCILSDVDGVMTDGRITYGDDGLELKAFHVRDGLAIKLWQRSGFGFGIVTARSSEAVTRRAIELGIEHVHQDCGDKWLAAQTMLRQLGVSPQQTAYIGDDLPDIAVMRHVGLAAAPADAAVDARAHAHWVLRHEGGAGAVRELIERLLRARDRWEEHVPD